MSQRVPCYITRLLERAAEARAGIHEMLSVYEYKVALAYYRSTLETLYMLLPRAIRKKLEQMYKNAMREQTLAALDSLLSETRRLIESYYASRIPITAPGTGEA